MVRATSMGRRTKKENVKKLRKEADKLWKEIVLRNYQGKCFVCGSSFQVDAHHFVPRRVSLNLRYDPENGIALCRKCHTALHWKSNPFIPVIIAFKKGKDWLKYLEEQKDKKVNPTKEWYKKQIERLKKYCLGL